MAMKEENRFEKEVDRIEAELGEDHLIRMLQCLTSSTPEASQGLLELHSECRDVISKLPPLRDETETTKKRTQSQGTLNRQRTIPVPPLPSRVKTEKPRIMLTKRTHTVVPTNTKKNVTT